MTAADAAATYAALYAPTCDELRRQLPDVGQGIADQLAELSHRPSLERVDQITATLSGAQVLVRKFREALAREGA
jgi:paraquat-inducible protein B